MSETNRILVEAGDYWLGDPCYSFNGPREDEWIKWLEAADYTNNQKVLHAKVPNTEFSVLGFGTAYGDGYYAGSDGNNYAVDAGLIGLVPVGYTNDEIPTYQDGSKRPICTRVSFKEDTECWIEYTENLRSPDSWARLTKWVLHFGAITIDTIGEDEDDESF